MTPDEFLKSIFSDSNTYSRDLDFNIDTKIAINLFLNFLSSLNNSEEDKITTAFMSGYLFKNYEIREGLNNIFQK